MSSPPAALTPLFRSPQQMRLLSEVYSATAPLSGVELSRRCGIAQQTVARELARLADAGLIVSERVGTSKLVRPNESLPYGTPLRQLLAYAGGVIPVLQEHLDDLDGVEEAFIFGSWAQRYRGTPGAPPNDVDVAIVSSTLTRFDLAELRVAVEAASGLSVNIFVFAPESDELAELRSQAVVVKAQRA